MEPGRDWNGRSTAHRSRPSGRPSRCPPPARDTARMKRVGPSQGMHRSRPSAARCGRVATLAASGLWLALAATPLAAQPGPPGLRVAQAGESAPFFVPRGATTPISPLSPASPPSSAPAATAAGAAGQPAPPAWVAEWTGAIRAREHARAETLARDARARGDPYGAFLLGVMLRDGVGVGRDPAGARALFGEAAALPVADAALGVMLMRGTGGPADLETALSRLSRAAEAGVVDAHYQLSLLRVDPRLERRDPVAAFADAHRAALAGHSAAIGRVGAMVLRGEGVTRDPDKALAWLRRGAERGDLASIGLLGEALATGAAGERDPKLGETLLLRAAEAGHGPSMTTLVELYDKGSVLPRDYASAYRWASIALARGHSAPGLLATRDALERRLTPERVASIQTAARTWTPRRLQAGGSAAAGEDPRAGTGTAFFVSADGHALTNEHVVRGCRRLSTTSHGDATVVFEDAAADLALVRVERPAPNWAQFRDAAPRLGEPVFVFGYPLYGMLSTGGNFTSGLVSSLVGLRDDARRIQITAPIQPGNSGGPVLDQHGRVIAIAVSMLRADVLGHRSQPQNVNFAVDAGVARKLLHSSGVSAAIAETAEPLSTEALAERASGFSTVLRCQR
jgi:TPR repeat protein